MQVFFIWYGNWTQPGAQTKDPASKTIASAELLNLQHDENGRGIAMPPSPPAEQGSGAPLHFNGSSTVKILTDLAESLNGSAYWNIASTYYDSKKVHPRDTLRFGGNTFVNTSAAGSSCWQVCLQLQTAQATKLSCPGSKCQRTANADLAIPER